MILTKLYDLADQWEKEADTLDRTVRSFFNEDGSVRPGHDGSFTRVPTAEIGVLRAKARELRQELANICDKFPDILNPQVTHVKVR